MTDLVARTTGMTDLVARTTGMTDLVARTTVMTDLVYLIISHESLSAPFLIHTLLRNLIQR